MNGTTTGSPSTTIRALVILALIGGAAAIGFLLSDHGEPRHDGPRQPAPPSSAPRADAPPAHREDADRLARIEAGMADLRERQATYERQMRDLLARVAEFERSAQPLPPELRARIEEMVAGQLNAGQVNVMREAGTAMIRSHSEEFIRTASLDGFQADRFRTVIDGLVEKRNEMIRRFAAGELDFPAMIEESSALMTGTLAEMSGFLTPEQYASLRATVEDLPPVRMGIVRIGEDAPAAQVPVPERPDSGR